jgi:hypothetical protein
MSPVDRWAHFSGVVLATLLWGCNPGQAGDFARSLTTVEALPAGEECPTGGQRIATGIDANGDGILEPEEVQRVAFVCSGQPSATCTTMQGSITIRNSFDWTNLALAGCTRITGTLEITAPGVRSLGAPSPLVEIGNLSVVANDLLTGVEFPALQTVTEGLQITSNQSLVGVSFPALTQVGGLVDVSYNASLRSLPLPALERVGDSLTVSSDGLLTSLSLPALSSVTGTILVFDLGISSLGAPLLEEAAVVEAALLPALTSIDLRALARVSTRLALYSDPRLPQCQADAVLARLSPPLPASVYFSGNDATATCP